MKIEVSKLSGRRELVLYEEWKPQAHELNAPGWLYKGPLKVSALAVRDSGIIRVEISIQAGVTLTCSRCLKDFPLLMDKRFELIYPVDLSEKIIVLDDDVRAELLLGYPQKILCKNDCRGLCQKCGVDLNEAECKCIKE